MLPRVASVAVAEIRRFVVAAVQLNASSDKQQNLDKAEGFIREAARAGARLVVLPEVFFWRGLPEQERDAAEPIPGPAVTRMGRLARDLGIYLLAGSILEQADARLPFNTSVLLDPAGEVVARYRKIHLFDVHVRGRVEIQESARRSAGNDVVVACTPLGNLGIAICYDLRFPELFRAQAAKGAEIILLPSAFTFVTGAAHWEPLVRARAIENQVYLVAPNQIGRGEGGVENYGHSCVVDPWGVLLAQARDQECVVYAEVDHDYLESVRRQLPALRHRRLRDEA
ncbi:MAG: carbon-nitrogen hydrolase family protein [Candidatus Binatia bacterium]|nr:carbon-nitrogen hydrolase family protein [Candidatus Binatia bacterium]